MNTIGIALVWCVVQVTLLGILAGGLYLLVGRLRPAAAAPVALSGLVMVVVLSLLALSPWPRWAFHATPQPPAASSAVAAESVPPPADNADRPSFDNSPLPLGEGLEVRAEDSPRPQTAEQPAAAPAHAPRSRSFGSPLLMSLPVPRRRPRRTPGIGRRWRRCC